MLKPIFNHEKLEVYQRALSFCAEAETLTDKWDLRHAVTDHLLRAAESIVENLAEASASRSRFKETYLDYSLGSVLECAACLDIAEIKQLVDHQQACQLKEKLGTIFRMLTGLRKSWKCDEMRDDQSPYQTGDAASKIRPVFHHEELDVYGVALDMMRWLCRVFAEGKLSVSMSRKLDASATSVVLNIAEGNGRFSELDHRRFLEVSHRSAIKMAAQLDLCVQRQFLEAVEVTTGKLLLFRIASMTGAMIRGYQESE